jgi:hypothetical protein
MVDEVRADKTGTTRHKQILHAVRSPQQDLSAGV